jgi:Ni/Fe-hydrogenase subunit HybB-like protein
MRLNFLRNILFPSHADWRGKRQRKVMFWVILVAVLLAVIMGALMLFVNSKTTH